MEKILIVDDENAYKENDNRIMIEYGEGTKEPKEIKKYAYKEKDVTELIKVYKIKSEKYIKKVRLVSSKLEYISCLTG